MGLSEETDALVIVVSEETARISVALRGRLERDVDVPRLREILGGVLPERGAALTPAPDMGGCPATVALCLKGFEQGDV